MTGRGPKEIVEANVDWQELEAATAYLSRNFSSGVDPHRALCRRFCAELAQAMRMGHHIAIVSPGMQAVAEKDRWRWPLADLKPESAAKYAAALTFVAEKFGGTFDPAKVTIIC